MMFNFDLAGAEWVIVAYLSNDANMIGVVQSKKSPHVVTGSLISGLSEDLVLLDHKTVGDVTNPDEIAELRGSVPALAELRDRPGLFIPRSLSVRQAGKKSNHGLNYGMGFRRFALENELPEADASRIHELYNTKAYPGLPKWRTSIQEELKKNNRVLTNCFGRKIRLLEEWGPELFDKAYAFKPQSTVADITNGALEKAYHDRRPCFEGMLPGWAQVHDSLMLQYPEDHPLLGYWLLEMRKLLSPPLTYGEHTFTLGVDLKVGRDWSNMVEVKWSDSPFEMRERVTAVARTLPRP